MRIKLVVLSVLLGGVAVFACLVLIPGAPLSRAQNPVVLSGDQVQFRRVQLSTSSPPRFNPAPAGPDEMFFALDRDRDGLLNYDEMPDALQDERQIWDVNGDRHINLAEWHRYIDAVTPPPPPVIRPPIIVQAPPKPQMNNPGSPPVSTSPSPKSSARPPFTENPKQKPPATAGSKYPKNMPPWFKEYDADEDGQVDLKEWQAKKDVLSEFVKYDLNDDGFITIEELIRSGQFIANTRAPQTVNQLQAEVGDFYYLEVTGAIRGAVWGTDVYTADSMLGMAAVHANVLEVGETGLVKVTVLAGQDRYEGSVRNGVTSQAFGMFPRSFRIEAVK